MKINTSFCLVVPLLLSGNYLASRAESLPATTRTATSWAAPDSLRLRITANGQVFTARFVDSETTHAFIQQLPLTLWLDDLGGREKYSTLPTRLPVGGSVRTAYQPGDISYWLGGGLAAFYHQDGHQVKAGLVVLARLEGSVNPFAALGPVKATFEAVVQ